MKRLKRMKIMALVALFVLTLAGCAGRGVQGALGGDDGSLQKILDAGQFVLGLDANYPPMGFTDESGEITGFDIDVAREVCARLGVALVTRPIDWDLKEEELNNGVIDCIWNGMSVTPSRAEAMALSEPYLKNELIFVVTGGSSAKTMRDLAGGTVGVQSGSSTEDVIKASAIYPEITVVARGDNLTLLELLREGELDAVLLDSVVAYYYISGREEPYFVLPDILSEEDLAIGFRKEDRALRDRVQELMSAMKSDGTLGAIAKQWFGSDITTIK